MPQYLADPKNFEKYDGAPDANKILNWKMEWDNHFDLDLTKTAADGTVSTPDDNRKIRMAMTGLTGRAKTWNFQYVKSHPEHPLNPNHSTFTGTALTWQAFVNAMKSNFVSDAENENNHIKWKNMKQRHNESILNFASRHKDLMNTLDPVPDDYTAKLHFLDALDPNISKYFRPTLDVRNTTMDALVNIATKASTIIHEAGPSSRTAAYYGSPYNKEKRPNNDNKPGPKPKIGSKNTTGALQRLSDKQRDYIRKWAGCFKCRDPNASHWTKTCPVEAKDRYADPFKVPITQATKDRKNEKDNNRNANIEETPYLEDYDGDNEQDEDDDTTIKGNIHAIFNDDTECALCVLGDTNIENCPLCGTGLYKIMKEESAYLSFFVNGFVNSHPVRVLLDTGASNCMIDPKIVNAANLFVITKDRPAKYKQASHGSFTVTQHVFPNVTTEYGVVNGKGHQRQHAFEIAPIDGFDIIIGRKPLVGNRILLRYLHDLGTNEHELANQVYNSIVAEKDKSESGVGEEELAVFDRINKTFINLYPDVFQPLSNSSVPPINPKTPTHKINLIPGSSVFNARAFPVPYKMLKPFKELLDKHLRSGRLIPSSSPYASPVFLKPKKDRTASPRWLNDYRELNKRTIRDATCAPRIDDVLRRAYSGRYKGIIDLSDAFSQTRMDPDSQKYTAIATPFGNYEWTIMPQGLTNAPSTNQRRVNDALHELLEDTAIPYVDDIIIFGADTIEEHKAKIKKVLDALRKAGLLANAKKSKLIATTIDVLGHVMSPKGLEADQEKLKKIMEWPAPTNKKQVHTFMGFLNWIRKFVPQVSTHTMVLNKLIAKNARFNWGPTQQEAFDTIKTIIKRIQPLRNIDYDSKDPIWLITDSSNTGIGGILAQGKEWDTAIPIEFESRQYNNAQKSYPTHEQELLAIMMCLKKWRNMILHTPFNICTDNESLKYLQTQRDLSPRQARWNTALSEYDFTITHIPGRKNIAADALSRYPHNGNHQEESTGPHTIAVTSSASFDQSILEEISKAYATDPFFKKAMDNIDSINQLSLRGTPPCLYFEERLCIPDIPRIKEKILHDHHDALGHFAIKKMFPSIANDFHWPNLHKDCEAYIQQCESCQRNKASTTKPTGILKPIDIPPEKCSHISIDWVEPLPESGTQRFNSVMGVTDMLSGFTVLIKAKTTDTAAISGRRFFDDWVKRFGLPDKITSDRDKRFTANFWEATCKIAGVERILTTSYHPQGDGRSEVTNKITFNILRPLIEGHHREWAQHLSAAEFAINSTVNASTGKSPFQVMYGFQPRNFPKPPEKHEVPSAIDPIKDFKNTTIEVRDALLKAKVNQAQHYNKNRNPDPDFQINDQVLLSTVNIRQRMTGPGQVKKLMPLWIGPFKIIARPNPNTYKLELPDTMKIHPTFNVNLLKAYHPNNKLQFPNRKYERPGPVTITDTNTHYEISDILDHRTYRRQLEYLVSWQGWPIDDNTWVAAKDINAPHLIKKYWDQRNESEPQVRKSPRLKAKITEPTTTPRRSPRHHPTADATKRQQKNRNQDNVNKSATGEKTLTKPEAPRTTRTDKTTTTHRLAPSTNKDKTGVNVRTQTPRTPLPRNTRPPLSKPTRQDLTPQESKHRRTRNHTPAERPSKTASSPTRTSKTTPPHAHRFKTTPPTSSDIPHLIGLTAPLPRSRNKTRPSETPRTYK